MGQGCKRFARLLMQSMKLRDFKQTIAGNVAEILEA